MTSLPLTGERTVPGIPDEAYWFARHEAVYRWIAGMRPRGVIVDAGAGEGYGAAMLGAGTIALEYDAAAAAHASSAYPAIRVVRANLAALPLPSASVDLVVSLQVIEHLWDLAGFLRDVRRVLRPGGSVIVSTPNRIVFSPGLGRGEKPTNPFHVEEFDAEQVGDLLAAAGFSGINVTGLHHGPRLREWESQHGSLVAAQVSAALDGTAMPGIVATVTCDDFELGAAQSSHDLIATATA